MREQRIRVFYHVMPPCEGYSTVAPEGEAWFGTWSGWHAQPSGVSGTCDSPRVETPVCPIVDLGDFGAQLNEIYRTLLLQQERLGPEFEDAIYSDLESLHDS